MLKTFVKDPLCHFLIASGLLFVGSSFWGEGEDASDEIITLDAARIEQLKNTFVQRWNREPLPEELDNAANHIALSEMYLREAKAMGFATNDIVIDRRLRQKMDFMLEDLASMNEPADAELHEFYQLHIEQFMAPATVSFKQITLSNDHESEVLAERLKNVSDALMAGGQPKGDLTLLPAMLTEQRSLDIDNRFGPGLSEPIFDAELGSWQGPFESPLGVHFVYVTHRNEAAEKPFSAIKPAVLEAWRYENFKVFKAAYESRLKERYAVVIHTPETNVAADIKSVAGNME